MDTASARLAIGALAETVARCAGGRSAECAVIDALYRSGPPAVRGRPAGRP